MSSAMGTSSMVASTWATGRPAGMGVRRGRVGGGRGAARSASCAPVRLEATSSVGGALVGVGAMYVLMSMNEYITHRYYQHAEFGKLPVGKALKAKFPGSAMFMDGGGHVEHHAETLDDMSLRKDEKWLRSEACARLSNSKNEWRGTAFEWQVTGLMTLQMIPSVFPVFMGLLGWSFGATVGFFLPSMLIHALAWNALHPPMHGLHGVPWKAGAASSVLTPLLETPPFKFMYTNHAGHHVSGGITNYNVCCPLFDHLLGTYEPEEVWQVTKEKKAKAALAGSA